VYSNQKGGKKMAKILINCSNHHSLKWDAAQREGWDIIEDIQFPTVPPEADIKEIFNIFEKVNNDILRVVRKYWPELYPTFETEDDIYLTILGEYTLAFMLFEEHKCMLKIAIPTTKREVIETPLPNGGVKKETVFKFVRWRIIDHTK
jgi:hypothetical protein